LFNNRCKEPIREKKLYIRVKVIKDPSETNIEIYKNIKKETNKTLRCEIRLTKKVLVTNEELVVEELKII